jgi:hypothetical protein
VSEVESKRAIEPALRAFATQPLKVVATGLFNALGYTGKKTLDLNQTACAGWPLTRLALARQASAGAGRTQ